MPVILELKRQRQEDCHKSSKCSRLARATLKKKKKAARKPQIRMDSRNKSRQLQVRGRVEPLGMVLDTQIACDFILRTSLKPRGL